MTKKKPAPKKKAVARKRPVPKRSPRRFVVNADHQDRLDRLDRLVDPTIQSVNMLLTQSAQDLKEINGLKNRLSNTEGVNRSMYARLNALEARPPAPSAVDLKAVREQVTQLQGILGSMQNSLPGTFLADYEVRRVRKIIAAMA